VAVRREVVRRFPEWTGSKVHDPGVTLLELFAFLAENLMDRATRSEKELLRNNYFFGRLLDADDFTVEQDYVREKFRRHNRRLHGFGIVSGLDVSIERRGADRVVVSSGFAVDRFGEEIDVRSPTRLPLPRKGSVMFVLLRYAERLRSPVPRAGAARKLYSRVEETFEATVAPTTDPRAIAIARLKRVTGKWQRDPGFEPPQANV
jgi:hypothetical protein